MEFNRIIIYCDYGLDDAIATLHILEHSHMFRHIDVVPIGGNVPVITAYRNAHSLLAAAAELGLSDKTKTRLIDTRAVPQPKANIPDIHGTDGIGDVLDHKPCDIPVVSIDEFARGALPVVYDLVAALAVTRPQDFDVVRVRRTDGVEYNELLFK